MLMINTDIATLDFKLTAIEVDGFTTTK